MNGAIIEVTNFMRSTANQGALWYETLPTGDDYWIDGMIANCIGTGEGDGFYNCVQLTNCTGTTTCMASGGFSACTRLTNCTGTGTGDYGYGFYNCVQLTNCTGASAEDGSDFYKCEYLSGCKSGKTSSATVLFEACNFVNLTGENQLVFTGKTVAVSAWSANSTYSAQGYAYRASVACTGVTASHRPDVAFGAADAVGGNFAPVADSYAGGVYIYCKTKPTATVTIPSIVCVKGA